MIRSLTTATPKKRYRADVLIEDQMAKYDEKINKEVAKASKRFGESFDEAMFRETNPRVLENAKKRDALHARFKAARYAAEISDKPVINAGDGAHEHPTQTMLDLYSIHKTQGGLDNLDICLVGDLKYGRTVHSLIQAMRHFSPRFHFVAPKELAMPTEYKEQLMAWGIPFEEHTDLTAEVIAKCDILYMTRVQRERFQDLAEYEKVKDLYVLRVPMLSSARPNMKIFHPLPRVNEIAYDVDDTPYAYYFKQAENGLYMREAIICSVLGIDLH